MDVMGQEVVGEDHKVYDAWPCSENKWYRIYNSQ